MINNIRQAVRSLGQKGRHNYMKIASLAIGLAVGLVLIAKSCFEQSFDSFYPDNDRIYHVYSKAIMNGELESWPSTSGGTVVFMKEMMPEIEAATRFTYLGENLTLTLDESKKKLKATYAVADSCLFDVLPRPVLQGDVKQTLSRPMYAAISDEMAEMMGEGDVIGKTFSFDGNENARLTVGAIFAHYPENSTHQIDIFVSMPSISAFTHDGSKNVVGNDRYRSYIKLAPNTLISQVEGQLPLFKKNYLPLDQLAKAGVDIDYEFYPVAQVHEKDESVRSMVYMLALVAFALIFVAVMNYILITVSSIIGRSKEVAVRKCYGASAGNIHGIIFAEAFVHVVIALCIAVLIIFTFQTPVSTLLGTPIQALLFSRSMWIVLGVSLVVLLVTGLLPGSLYARIPVAAAFRNYRESKRIWKLTLLFVQFTAAVFLVILLLVVNRQYQRMTDDDPGYTYEDLAYIPISVLSRDTTSRQLIIQELARLPEVQSVGFSSGLPMDGSSGDNVMLPGEDRELFNCADQFYASSNFFELMGIPVIEGEVFNPELDFDTQVMVSRSFADYLRRTTGWEGSVVGKRICVTSHNYNNKSQEICGVFEDYRLGTISYTDDRPIALFCASHSFYQRGIGVWGNVLVRYHRLTPEALQHTRELLARLVPTADLPVYAYKNELVSMYIDTRNFRDSITIGGAVALAILIIGLVGYIADEVNRRRKEIAIRKINGAVMADIQRIFLKDLAKILLPAIVLGVPLAWKVSEGWQQQFSEKVPLSWYFFVGGVLLVIAVIFSVSSYNVHRIANDNPANSLKVE